MLIMFVGGVAFLQEEGHTGRRVWPKLAETRPLYFRALRDERGEGWVRQRLFGWDKVRRKKLTPVFAVPLLGRGNRA